MIDTTRSIIGRVVIDFHIGCRYTTLRVVVGHLLVECFRETHQHYIKVLVFQSIDIHLRNSLLRYSSSGNGINQRCHTSRQILHAQGHQFVGSLCGHLFHGHAHEAVNEINQQAWHDDRGEQHLSVAKESGKLFLDDCQCVAFHSSPPFTSLYISKKRSSIVIPAHTSSRVPQAVMRPSMMMPTLSHSRSTRLKMWVLRMMVLPSSRNSCK